MDTKPDALLQTLTNDLQRLNKTITQVADGGVTVELVRRSRYHTTTGNWGDQMMPVFKPKA